jgi:hypothetical protein
VRQGYAEQDEKEKWQRDYSSELTESAAVRVTRRVLMIAQVGRVEVGGQGTVASYSSRMLTRMSPRTPVGVGRTIYRASPHSNVLCDNASSRPA